MNNKLKTFAGRMACAFVIAAIACTTGTAATINVSGDAQIFQAQPDNNYGGAVSMGVNASTSGLLGFNLSLGGASPLPSTLTSGQVTKATLTVFLNTVSTTGNVDVGICNVW